MLGPNIDNTPPYLCVSLGPKNRNKTNIGYGSVRLHASLLRVVNHRRTYVVEIHYKNQCVLQHVRARLEALTHNSPLPSSVCPLISSRWWHPDGWCRTPLSSGGTPPSWARACPFDTGRGKRGFFVFVNDAGGDAVDTHRQPHNSIKQPPSRSLLQRCSISSPARNHIIHDDKVLFYLECSCSSSV